MNWEYCHLPSNEDEVSESESNCDSPVLPTGPFVDPVPMRKARRAIHSMRDSLWDETTFAMIGRVFDGESWAFWDTGPDAASAVTLLQEIEQRFQMGETKNRKCGFTIPGSSEVARDDASAIKDRRIDRYVCRLKDSWICTLAVFWQSVADGPVHFRVLNYPVDEAFDDFATCLAEEGDSELDVV